MDALLPAKSSAEPRAGEPRDHVVGNETMPGRVRHPPLVLGPALRSRRVRAPRRATDLRPQLGLVVGGAQPAARTRRQRDDLLARANRRVSPALHQAGPAQRIGRSERVMINLAARRAKPVRRRPEPEVVAPKPVHQVVPAFAARTAEVRCLVERVAGGDQAIHQRFVQVRLPLGREWRLHAGARGISQRSSRLGNEAVRRQMLRFERERRLQRLRPGLGRMTGEAEHQVERQTPEAVRPRQRECLGRAAGGVNAAQSLELARIEALRSIETG